MSITNHPSSHCKLDTNRKSNEPISKIYSLNDNILFTTITKLIPAMHMKYNSLLINIWRLHVIGVVYKKVPINRKSNKPV